MAVIKKKKGPGPKKKKIRYRKVELRLTDGQKKKIERYCVVHRTTLKHLFKKAVGEYMDQHGGEVLPEEPVSKNQLKLFDL